MSGPPRIDLENKVIYSDPLPINATDDECEVIIGDMDHECGHGRYTDHHVSQKKLKQCSADMKALNHGIHNALEDTFIERRLGNDFLGCRETLARSVEIIEEQRNTPDFSNAHPANVLMAYLDSWGRVNVLQQNVKKTLDGAKKALEELLEKKGMRKLNSLLASNLYSADSTQDTWDLTQSVMQLLKEVEEEQKKEEQEPENQDQDQQQQEDDSDADNSDDSQAVGANAPGGDDSSDGSNDAQAQGSPEETGNSSDNSETGGKEGGFGAGEILSDSDFDTNALFDRKDVAKEAIKQASGSSWNAGGYSDCISRNSNNTRVYHQLRDSLSSEIRDLQRHIELEYQTRTRQRSITSDMGRMDGRRLVRALTGDPRIYRHKVKRQLPLPAVSVVLDCSGSMSSQKILLAKQAMIVVAETNERLNVKTQLIGYEGYGVEVVKDFDEPLQRTQGRVGSLIGSGGTPTAEALWEAGNRIAARKEERKLILLVTDGYPNDVQGAKEVSEMISRSGIEVYGIGIGTDAVNKFCQYHAVIHSSGQIASAVLNALRDRILRAA
ncbi:MAG: VWA domain-containing protein [Bacteroidetes bacterium]|nr:VWA domain-containing protein [Bacteroidota bacterium]